MNRSKPDILAYIQSTRFHWINDSNDPWDELPWIIQQAAMILGYSPSLWDDSITTPTKNTGMATPSSPPPTPPIPPLFHEPWCRLTAAQQQAAHTLGYTQHSWDDAFLDDEHVPSDDEEDQENEQDDDERDDSPGNDGDRHHQGEVRRILQSPSDDVHINRSMKDVMYEWDTDQSRTATYFDDTATDHAYSYRKEPEDVTHDVYLEHEYGRIKTVPTKATTTPTTANFKDGIDDDEFITTFSSEESIEPIATASTTHCSADKGICDDDDVGTEEFIANFLSEDIGMSTAATRTGVEIPSDNQVFEDADEEEFITNFLSVEAHVMETKAENIRYGPPDRFNVNVNDMDYDAKNDETIETTFFTVTLDPDKEHRANIESINSQLHGAPDTRSISTRTPSTGKHCLSDICDDVEAHEASPLLLGQPGVDMETSTLSTPDADAPMGPNRGGQQLLIRRILLGSKSTTNCLKVAPQASLSRRAKNTDKIEGDHVPYRSLAGVMILSVAVCASIAVWWIVPLPRT